MSRKLSVIAALLFACLFAFPAFGEGVPDSSFIVSESGEVIARDISRECTYNNLSGSNHPLTDGTYAVFFQSSRQKKDSYLRITAPEGEVIGAIYVQWYYFPPIVDIQTQNEDGSWTTVAQNTAEFFAEYIPIPNLADFRLVIHDKPTDIIYIREMKVLTPGTPPEGIQLWQSPGDKVDLMLLVGHPDDEVLWFGGLLPYYGGELKKNVLVVCASMNWSLRRLELCDCLWACGVRTHPIHSKLVDIADWHSVKEALANWGKEKCLRMYTEYIRRYKPDVLVLHDVNGEYGHAIHQTSSWLGRECAVLAANPEVYPDQVEKYGTWDVPKIYIHLYPENQIRMDWSVPLKSFGGKTALQVAREAYAWHKSQSEKSYAVVSGGKYDNSVFGLYRTLVGPDVLKNDLFENIAPREDPE